MSDSSLVKMIIMLASLYYFFPLWSYARYLQDNKKNYRGGIAVVSLGVLVVGTALLY